MGMGIAESINTIIQCMLSSGITLKISDREGIDITDTWRNTHIIKDIRSLVLLNSNLDSTDVSDFILKAWNNWLRPSVANAIVLPVVRAILL